MNRKTYYIYQLYWMSKEFKELGMEDASKQLLKLYIENKKYIPEKKKKV